MQMAQHWFFVGKIASRSSEKPLVHAFLGILLPMLPQHINKIFLVFLLILRYAILCQLTLCCCCSIVGKYVIYQASKTVFNVGKMLVFLKVEVSESLYLQGFSHIVAGRAVAHEQSFENMKSEVATIWHKNWN